MVTLFEDAENIFDIKTSSADMFLTDALTEFYESCADSIFYEKQGDTLSIKIKKFVANMVTAMTEFINSIKVQVTTKLYSAQMQKSLRKTYDVLKSKKAQGQTQVALPDLWTIRDTYINSVHKLEKYAKRFANMNYKTSAKLEEDLDTFNKIYEQCEKDIIAASKKTKTVHVDKALAFIDAECSGNGKVMKSMTEAATEFVEMGNAAQALAKKADILGPDIIQKHVGFIKRQMIKIANFIKKFAVKIIVTACLLVG